jgi:mRNA-degrading endonuclease YafQ of YafQ-DinJ toxin-antitoxin module
MYKLKQSKSFYRAAYKLIKLRRISFSLFEERLRILSINPFDKNLKTHKVNSKKIGLAYSSSLNADIRIIWSFDQEENLCIHLLDIGGHSGSNSVY